MGKAADHLQSCCTDAPCESVLHPLRPWIAKHGLNSRLSAKTLLACRSVGSVEQSNFRAKAGNGRRRESVAHEDQTHTGWVTGVWMVGRCLQTTSRTNLTVSPTCVLLVTALLAMVLDLLRAQSDRSARETWPTDWIQLSSRAIFFNLCPKVLDEQDTTQHTSYGINLRIRQISSKGSMIKRLYRCSKTPLIGQ